MRKRREYAKVALRYARDVAEGRMPACQWHRAACQRFLDDLRRVGTADFPYRFDRTKANAACRFAELMPHVKGHWAEEEPELTSRRGLIDLQDFQVFERAMLFGWIEASTGFRRFRRAYIERPRKNAKSTDAAITGLYMLGPAGEMGAEVYSGATTEKQANEVFGPARLMARRSPHFLEAFGVTVNAQSLTILSRNAKFERLIGNPGDGASPSCAIVDEYHEHDKPSQYDTMESGMGARQQPLLLVITTAGEGLEGPCYLMHEAALKVLEKTFTDERLFTIIYTIDPGDDWTSEAALIKANPNYGVSVSAEYLEDRQRQARHDASKQSVFKTKHLNVWTAARSPWMNLEWWHRQADPSLRLEDFAGQRCWMGFDLASRMDLVAVGLMFQEDRDRAPHYTYFGRCYVPRATAQEPERRHYQKWIHEGHLTETEGNDCDLERILADVAADRVRFQVQQAGIDPWNSIGLRDGLQGMDIEAIEIPQNTAHFSESMKTLEAAVKDGRFHHDGNPCLTWMISNVTVKEDPNGNIFPRKERRDSKIDGAVALIMAGKLALLNESVDAGFAVL